MASQDKLCSSRLASIRSPQLSVGHSACRMRSPLSKKLHLLPLSIGRIIQPRGDPCAGPTPSRRLGRGSELIASSMQSVISIMS
jgi:hypothetical protein